MSFQATRGGCKPSTREQALCFVTAKVFTSATSEPWEETRYSDPNPGQDYQNRGQNPNTNDPHLKPLARRSPRVK